MRKILFVAWILIFAALQPARSQSDDLQLWTKASIKWDLSKTTRIYGEEEVRFFENLSRLNKINTEVGMSHEFSDRWEATFFYRLINNRTSEGFYYHDHRVAIQFSYKYKWRNWQFWGTPRFQLTYDDFGRSKNWRLPETYLRTEFGLSKNLKQLNIEPHVDFELWYNLERAHPIFVDQYRLTAGVEYKVDKTHRWDFFYRYQWEIQVKNPDSAHIFGVSYKFYIRK